MGFTKNEKKGILWSAIDRFSSQGIQFIVSIVLARLLMPSDYGMVAIALVFISIFNTINEYGILNALIYKHSCDDKDYSTALIANLFIGLLSYIIVLLLSYPASIFFNMPGLMSLLNVMGLGIFINSFSIVQKATYTINLDFKTQSKATVISSIISGLLGVTCALFKFGVWSLVIQYLSQSLIQALLLWYYSKWRPKSNFDKDRFIFMFNYGYKLILSHLINIIYNNLYSLIIGRLYSPALLGFYNRAFSLQTVSSKNIVDMVQRVSMPVLCENKGDYSKLKEIQEKYIKGVSFLVIPMLVGLFVLSDSFIYVLLTEKWMESSWILRVLCPVGILYIINTFNRNVLSAFGRTDLMLKNEVVKKALISIIILISTCWGFKGLVYSQIIVIVIETIIDSYYPNKFLKINLLKQFSCIIKIILSSLLMGLVIYIVNSNFTNYNQKLFIGIIIGIIVYYICCLFFNINDIRFKTINILLKNKSQF